VNLLGGAFGLPPRKLPPGEEKRLRTFVNGFGSVRGVKFSGPLPFIDWYFWTMLSTGFWRGADEISNAKSVLAASGGRSWMVMAKSFTGGGSAQKAVPVISKIAMARRGCIGV
jgi:hypothetical protein